jgi:hypothetical protein
VNEITTFPPRNSTLELHQEPVEDQTMTAFLSSLVALLACCGLVLAYAKRRPVGTPTTWGEAMVSAVFIFAVMFLAYGIVPHQFLNWADSELKWRPDAFGIPLGWFGKDGFLGENGLGNSRNVLFGDGITFFGRGRVLISKETIRDILAAGLYIVFLGGQIYMWMAWQNRGKKAEAKLKAIAESSTYGRPLLKRA